MMEEGDTVVVAVSGGLDSVVLLDLLVRLRPALRIELTVAHLDHAFRLESDSDARFVEALAAAHGLPFDAERLTAEDLEPVADLGPEGGARALRLSYLERAAGRFAARRIALGHHANDRAETVLYRLARGTGPEGLEGIRPTRGAFVRPMIDLTRAEVLAYAKDRGLQWREDATNAELRLARNRIRHRVLPELEEIHSHATQAICRAADLLAEHREALDHFVDRALDALLRPSPGDRWTLDRSALRAHPPAVQSLILRQALRRVRGDLDGIDRGHIRDLRTLLDSDGAHAELHLPRCIARLQADGLSIVSDHPESEPGWSRAVELGRTAVQEHGFSIDLRLVDHGSLPADCGDRSIEYADADRIAFPLTIRSRRPGDRFEPLGMPEIKLKDFYINQHVPYYEREHIPLLCDRDRIVWVVGVRLSDAVRCDRSTRRMLRMQMEVMS